MGRLNNGGMKDGDASSDGSRSRRLKILGVAGGIGAGKSAACQLLVNELGCVAHIDADRVAHAVYGPGSDAVGQISEAFGPDVVDPDTGAIDRKRLGSKVFASRDEMRKLEHIVWPHTEAEIVRQIETIRSSSPGSDSTGGDGKDIPVVIVEAAVLLEAEWYKFMDGVWMVTVPTDVAVERLVESRGCPREEAVQRIEAQTSRRGIGDANLQREVADKVVTAVVDNSGSLEELKRRLAESLSDPGAWYQS